MHPRTDSGSGHERYFHVAMLVAGAVRQLGFRIVRNPIVDGPLPNPAHALIMGSRSNSDNNLVGALTKGESERLARMARIVIFTVQQQAPEP